MVHRADRGKRGIRLVDHGLVQVTLHENAHTLVQGGGKQHPLPAGAGPIEDAPHHREEAHIGHVIGFVNDGDLHAAEVHVPLTHEIEEPARAGHEDVDATRERLDLGVLAHAAVNGVVAELCCGRKRPQRLRDLVREFPGGGEDQRARVAGDRAAPVRSEARDHGKEEGIGLAGAGPAAAEDIPARERVRQCGRLDGGGVRDSEAREHAGELGGHAKARKVMSHEEKNVRSVGSCRARSGRT